MTLQERIQAVQENIIAAAQKAGRDPREITLCAATKVQTDHTIQAAIAGGIRVCGENRVQELTAHWEAGAYAGAEEVHFIGRLQTNKVKFVVGRADLIHSVGSLHLLRAIEKEAAKQDLIQDLLLEVNIGREESKGGCPPEEVMALAAAVGTMAHVRLRGLMAIPPVSSSSGANLPYFSAMHQLYVDITREMTDNHYKIDCLSMGMSADYPDAIAQGATLVRVGTALFGPRPPMGQHR